MKLSKEVNQYATDSLKAVGTAYEPLAGRIALAVAVAKGAADAAKSERESVWTLFKGAVAVGVTAKHSPEAMRAGLEYACTVAGIPAGTLRGYASTVENLYRDRLAFKAAKGKTAQVGLSQSEVDAISVADARKRYKAAPTAAEQARTRIAEAIKEWTVEQLTLLETIIAESAATPATGEQEAPQLEAATA